MRFKFDDSVEGAAELNSSARLHPFLVKIISEASSIPPHSIVDLELQLIDVQPPTLGGASKELLFGGRLDNLCSSYQALRALIDTAEGSGEAGNIKMAMLFDHEEVGSASCTGAGSSLFMDTLRTINEVLAGGSHCKCKYFIFKIFKTILWACGYVWCA